MLDGGYGRHHAGRWNRQGELVTYCASVPSLCILEKLVHIEDVDLFPNNLQLVELTVPDGLAVTIHEEGSSLPNGWHRNLAVSQDIGSAWYDSTTSPLLRVPSVIARTAETTDRNWVINHRHPDAAHIVVAGVTPFDFDHRLLRRPSPGV
jgi:RES domain-containing protein